MVRSFLKKALAFEREAHNILAIHETSVSRIILLEDTYKKLSKLSLQQDELIRQALRCIENRLYRSAYVMAWAGFMDFLEQKIASDNFKKLSKIRPKWNIVTIDDLRERIPEYQIIEATKDLGFCNKNEMKALHGLLNRRNECAHPSDYFPGLNESLGYISELLNRIKNLHVKVL